ncbi:MAG: putative peptide zinc metalloprotease protein [Frankiaceae bacterium]|jgi:putative peptide zinc metalloprotease protein|nr:putative peptide zinc metalloprotease protein [Frankiaceae bacterium]
MAPNHPDAPPGERTDPWRSRRRRSKHTHPHSHPHAAQRHEGTSPSLADGVSLLGEYEGSGYKEPHYLARKANGGVVQLSHLLFLVADACDGRRDNGQIAAQVSERYGKTVTADNVETLLTKLRPIGVVTAADGSSPETPELDPLLALRWRTSLVGEQAVRRLTMPFRPLFLPPVIAAVVAGLIGFDLWLFFSHGLAQGLRQTIQGPTVFLLVAGLVVLSAGFHEVGHATACVYSGGQPGRMGFGVYLAWPAFYTDVTDAHRLPRAGRLRTDLGGIYFNAIFVLGLAGVWWGTRFEPLLLVAFLLQIEIVHQMLPFLRLDGYYVLSDIAGVPDLFKRIGPILRSTMPGRPKEKEVTELKRWVRSMVTIWVAVVVPILLFNLGMILVNAPRILATAWDEGAKLVYQMSRASAAMKAVDGLQLAFLAVPILGMAFTFVRVGQRALTGSWRWSAGHAGRRPLVALGWAAVIALLALAWWPDGRVTPYRPGEKGTLAQSVASLRAVGQGRPLIRSPHQAAMHPLSPVAPGTSAGDLARSPSSPAPAPAGTTDNPAPSQDSGGSAPSDSTSSPTPSATPSVSPSAEPTSTSTATPSATSSPTP